MAMYSVGRDFLRDLVRVLGLQGQPVTKIVIEAAVDNVTKVYVVGLLHRDKESGIIHAIASEIARDVSVADDATVVVER